MKASLSVLERPTHVIRADKKDPTEARSLLVLLHLVAERKARDGMTAYVCVGMICQAPVSTLPELQTLLSRWAK